MSIGKLSHRTEIVIIRGKLRTLINSSSSKRSFSLSGCVVELLHATSKLRAKCVGFNLNSNQSICPPRPLKVVQSTCLVEVVSFTMLSYAEYAHMIGPSSSTTLHLSSLSTQDIRVTSIQHSHGSATEKFTASSSEFNLLGKKSKQKEYPPKS
jgi:hypothetical protein